MSLTLKKTKVNNLHTTYTLEGNDIHFSLINSIRRISFSSLPCYAFKDNIDILNNIPIMNKEQLVHRISMLPIYKIILDGKNINLSNGKLIMSVNKKNDSDIDVFVTTNDVELTYNMKSIPNFYDPKNPIIISKLRPNYSIIFNATAQKGVGEENSCFRPGLVHYKEEGKKFILSIESDGYYTPDEILVKSCELLIQSIELLKNKIGIYIKNSDEQNINIEVPGEDHTVGNIITSYLRQHPDILFTGYSIDHPYSKILNIISICKKGKSNIKCINDTIDKLIKVYNKIMESI